MVVDVGFRRFQHPSQSPLYSSTGRWCGTLANSPFIAPPLVCTKSLRFPLGKNISPSRGGEVGMPPRFPSSLFCHFYLMLLFSVFFVACFVEPHWQGGGESFLGSRHSQWTKYGGSSCHRIVQSIWPLPLPFLLTRPRLLLLQQQQQRLLMLFLLLLLLVLVVQVRWNWKHLVLNVGFLFQMLATATLKHMGLFSFSLCYYVCSMDSG